MSVQDLSVNQRLEVLRLVFSQVEQLAATSLRKYRFAWVFAARSISIACGNLKFYEEHFQFSAVLVAYRQTDSFRKARRQFTLLAEFAARRDRALQHRRNRRRRSQ